MAKSTIATVFLLLFLAGCSYDHSGNKYLPYPVAEDRPLAYQEKLQAAAHWEVLAANEAEEILKTLGTTSITFNGEEPDTDFAKAYKKMLTGHLLDKNIRVLNSGGNHVVKFQVQVVRHTSRDLLNLPAGLMTTMTTGALLIAQATSNWNHPGLIALPIAVAEDMFLAESKEGYTPNTEVLITTELYHLGEIVQSSTRIYYFNEGDELMYEVGPTSPDPNPDRSFKITNQL